MGRLHAIRLAVIGTFAFYGVMHLQGSAEVFQSTSLKRSCSSFQSSALLSLESAGWWNGCVVATLGLAFFCLPSPLFFTLHLPQDIDATFAKNSLISAQLIAMSPLRGN